MFICCPNDWRKLRNLITAILKSWLTTEVKRLNYIKSYRIDDKKIIKQDEKLIRIDKISDEKKLDTIISKTFPEANILN